MLTASLVGHLGRMHILVWHVPELLENHDLCKNGYFSSINRLGLAALKHLGNPTCIQDKSYLQDRVKLFSETDLQHGRRKVSY